MCETSGTEASEDHIARGFEVLQRLGYPMSEYLTASLGRGPEGEAQVLIMGGSHIEIRTIERQVLLDVGIREIRSVRFVAGMGLEIWARALPGSDDFGKWHWDHHLSDFDAKYLENFWLQAPPFLHDGIQLNSRPWREEEYAYFVGRVLTEAAHCEVRLSSLLCTVQMLGFELSRTPKGSSGKPLVKLLAEVGRQSAAFEDLAERYEAWYEWRNFSAHGVRYEDSPGRPSRQVFKMKTRDDGTGEDFEARDQDFVDLARLWSAFYFIGHDVASIAIGLSRTQGALEETLKSIPISNSVSAEQRLP